MVIGQLITLPVHDYQEYQDADGEYRHKLMIKIITINTVNISKVDPWIMENRNMIRIEYGRPNYYISPISYDFFVRKLIENKFAFSFEIKI